MSHFELQDFVNTVRKAAAKADAKAQVRQVMTAVFSKPDAIRTAMQGFSGEGEVLFEDDTVSIWYAGFEPQTHVPPHDHQTTAIIGVYAGVENNHFYKAHDGALEHKSTRCMHPGDVIAMGPDAIHSVETANDAASYGLHVYLAPLTRIERSLFDWDSGAACPLTEAGYEASKRPSTV